MALPKACSTSMTSIAEARHKHSCLPAHLEAQSNHEAGRCPVRINSCLASVWALQSVHTRLSACEAPFNELGPQRTKRCLADGAAESADHYCVINTMFSMCPWGAHASKTAFVQSQGGLRVGMVGHLNGSLGEPDLGHSVQSALGLSAGHTLQ